MPFSLLVTYVGIEFVRADTEQVWKVAFRDEGKWLFGLYSPENTSLEEVDFLEKHDGPELFYLMNGAVTLVVKEKEEIEEIPLQRDIVVIVDTWHNAYSPKGKRGVCLVIEKDGVSSEIQKIVR